jgi:hypothetical protein
MIMAGYQHRKVVASDLRATPETGRSLINWIAELTVPEKTPPEQDWNHEVPGPLAWRSRTGASIGWMSRA